jgi:hypothetical protein
VDGSICLLAQGARAATCASRTPAPRSGAAPGVQVTAGNWRPAQSAHPAPHSSAPWHRPPGQVGQVSIAPAKMP